MAATSEPTVSDIDLRDSSVRGTSAELSAVLAVPAGTGPWPAVVLVHEIFGITDVMRRQVIRIAQAGTSRSCRTCSVTAVHAGAWSARSARYRRAKAAPSPTSRLPVS